MDASIELKSIENFDVDQIHKWKNNQELCALMAAVPLPVSYEQTLQWLEHTRNDPKQIIFGIHHLAEDKQTLIGISRLMNIDWVSQVAELGIYIGPSKLRGKSLGRASLHATLAHAFRQLNLQRIWLRVFATNQPAIGLYRSTGFIEEGRLRKHAFANGSLQDMLVFGLLADEFSPIKMTSED